jgi:hypothetical protein
MGLEIGGQTDEPAWPKMGPSLLIANVPHPRDQDAKGPPRSEAGLSDADLQIEIGFAAHLASRVLSTLISKHPSIFPSVKKPWYQATDEDVMK